MTTLIIIRHGLTEYNIENRIQGHLDTALTQEGLDQAEQAAEYIADHYNIDAIYSSDLSRAMNTAKPLAKRFELPIHPERDLRELCLGHWEGLLYAEGAALYPETAAKRKENPALVRYDGGESFEDLGERALRAVTRIAEENDGKTVAIASHGGTIRALLCLWHGRPISETYEIPAVPNTAINVVTYENGEFTILKENVTEHLTRLTVANVE